MATYKDILTIKSILVQLENDILNWFDEDDEDVDYEDLKSRIYENQGLIKSIVELWEE